MFWASLCRTVSGSTQRSLWIDIKANSMNRFSHVVFLILLFTLLRVEKERSLVATDNGSVEPILTMFWQLKKYSCHTHKSMFWRILVCSRMFDTQFQNLKFRGGSIPNIPLGTPLILNSFWLTIFIIIGVWLYFSRSEHYLLSLLSMLLQLFLGSVVLFWSCWY